MGLHNYMDVGKDVEIEKGFWICRIQTLIQNPGCNESEVFAVVRVLETGHSFGATFALIMEGIHFTVCVPLCQEMPGSAP